MTEAAGTAWASAADLAQRIRRRELSPVELMKSTIERIERRNPSLNAFIYLDFDQAMERARAAEAAITSGAAIGLLHGVPAAMKDLFDFKPGWPATFGGVRALRNQVIDAYCPFAERMERAGAILVGKTNAPVMGLRGIADNYLFGPTHNPFDPSRNPGGRRAAARRRWPTGWCRSPKAPTPAGRSAFPPPGATCMDIARRSAGSPSPAGRTRSQASRRFCSRER